MSTDIQPAAADRQRARAFRRNTPAGSASNRPTTEPPRQRRPALAALALLLIVGGALAAGLLAVRMDSREPVLGAARDIPAGTLITAEDLREVQVASEDVSTISLDLLDQVVGTYAKVPIPAKSLVTEPMLTTTSPVSDDRAEVAIPLNPALTPAGLASGDLVQVIRISGAGGDGGAEVLGEGLVMEVSDGSSDQLGGSQAGSLNLLVPAGAAASIVNAAGSSTAGLAILDRGQSTDVDLSGPEQ
ncbi:MAG TPA: SAF domain-containing protein [Nocardioides sp.]|uniref:SAF domain-containing protein n=1 Tax=Nocardioides sp. TaxID=35761 RepID=UPI002BA728F2|nr:SAF domain-containing protein [Nocardioides sp.]HTW18485.1 SAF domain-containing protein [Nocardioides sp.]